MTIEEENCAEKTNGFKPICRSDGVNESERYLKKLCDHSFLSLWSYSSIFRDQGKKGAADDGKEICDLLVVFGNDVLIFSDKYCKFKDSGNLELDWSRWYRDAILDNAKEIWGAERWIKNFPERVFLDKTCTQQFPISLPYSTTARYHRIVVAHGASERCKKELGGSGSLMIAGNSAGQSDFGIDPSKTPFSTGQIDLTKGFVHVFDDTSLDIVLQTLDTISDFVAYLTKKEAFISSNHFIQAAGEEELLANYLSKLNSYGEHDFVFPPQALVIITEGNWTGFCKKPQRLGQFEANKISYAWDNLIEGFNKHNLAGTQYFVTHSLKDIEFAIRFLAAENRTSRRHLSESFIEIIRKTPPDERAVRITKSPWQKGLFYVFMVFPHHNNISEEDYRAFRRFHLMQYCIVSKLKHQDAEHIVGIATDSGVQDFSSEDLVYYDATDWTTEDKQEAESISKDFNILKNVRRFEGNIQEYPTTSTLSPTKEGQLNQSFSPYRTNSRIGRNNICPCGSGNKFKRCHGK